MDSQASKNQHETSAVEAAWKDAKEKHKKMKKVIDEIEEYDVALLEDPDLSDIKVRSKKIKEQADRRSVRYLSTNEIYRKYMEKSVNKKNNIKLETMTVPTLDTKQK